MDKYIFISPQNNIDIEICQCGIEECENAHFFGPAIRNHYLIHYIVSGKGIFVKNDVTHSLSAGQGFLITPFELTYYEADREEPWTYIWVGFSGRKADILLNDAGINKETPVFSNPNIEKCMYAMVNSNDPPENTGYHEMIILGELYKMFAILISENKRNELDEIKGNESVLKAMEFIRNNISNNLSVEQIAGDLGYNRNYFSQLFKKHHGTSIMQYIINCRMERACNLLKNDSLRISDVARSVGYSDQLFFSRQFKKVLGKGPQKYREEFI